MTVLDEWVLQEFQKCTVNSEQIKKITEPLL